MFSLKSLGFSFLFFILQSKYVLMIFSLENSFFLVSIAPQKYFVDKIIKNKHKVLVLTNKRGDIHNIDILPSQLLNFKNLKGYFIIDHPLFMFEKQCIDFFKKSKQYENIDIVSWRLGFLNKKDNSFTKDWNALKDKDPHLWFSIEDIKIFLNHVYNYLVKIDGENEKFYKKNLDEFLKEINDLDLYIINQFEKLKHRDYLSYHSSLFYYAKRYGLRPIFIEEKNRSTSGLKIYKLHKLVKEKKLNFILIDNQYKKFEFLNFINNNLKKIYWNPLEENWLENMKFITNIFYENLI